MRRADGDRRSVRAKRVELNRRKVAEIADLGPRGADAGEGGFTRETAIGSRGALNYLLEKAKNVRTTATNLRAGARPFHNCTGKPAGIHLAAEPLETPARVWQAR